MVEFDDESVVTRAVFDSEVSEDDLASMSFVETEVLADMADSTEVTCECITVAAPRKIELPGFGCMHDVKAKGE